MNEGYILCHVHHNVKGILERIDYTWKGGPECLIAVEVLEETGWKEGDPTAKIGPFRLRVIERDLWSYHIRCIREDYPLWWVRLGWHRASKLLDIAYRRLIITLAVWKLADYHQAVIPSWQDIHLLRRLAKRK